jgi:hypothetical protein
VTTRLVWYHIQSLRMKKFIAFYVLVQTILFAVASSPSETGGFLAYFNELHSGPLFQKDMMNGLGWYLPFMISIYFMGVSLEEDFSSRSEYLFVRIKRKQWYHSRLFFIIYYSLGIVSLKLLLSIIFFLFFEQGGWHAAHTMNELLFDIFLVFFSFTTVCTLYLILFMLIGTNMSFISISALLLIPWFIGLNKGSELIPGIISMLHYDTPNLLVSGVLLAAFVASGHYIVNKKDIAS